KDSSAKGERSSNGGKNGNNGGSNHNRRNRRRKSNNNSNNNGGKSRNNRGGRPNNKGPHNPPNEDIGMEEFEAYAGPASEDGPIMDLSELKLKTAAELMKMAQDMGMDN